MRLLRFLRVIDAAGQAQIVALEDDEGVGLDRQVRAHRHFATGTLVALERVPLLILRGVVHEGQRPHGGGEDGDELPLRLPLFELLQRRGLLGNRQVELVFLFIGGRFQGDAELLLHADPIGGSGVGDADGSDVDDGNIAGLGQHGWVCLS